MIRAAELALFLSPVALYLLWRRFGTFVPTRMALVAMLAAMVVIGAGLAWSGLQDRHSERSQYVPAQLQDGRIIPGHDS